jgi:hypothetical protein
VHAAVGGVLVALYGAESRALVHGDRAPVERGDGEDRARRAVPLGGEAQAGFQEGCAVPVAGEVGRTPSPISSFRSRCLKTNWPASSPAASAAK